MGFLFSLLFHPNTADLIHNHLLLNQVRIDTSPRSSLPYLDSLMVALICLHFLKHRCRICCIHSIILLHQGEHICWIRNFLYIKALFFKKSTILSVSAVHDNLNHLLYYSNNKQYVEGNALPFHNASIRVWALDRVLLVGLFKIIKYVFVSRIDFVKANAIEAPCHERHFRSQAYFTVGFKPIKPQNLLEYE